MSSYRIPEAVKRVLPETFAARDIAEPSASFDVGASCGDVRTYLDSPNDIVGWDKATPLTGTAYRVADRSVAMLYTSTSR
jgi:hypothetical protein